MAKNKGTKRFLKPDYKFSSLMVSKFINKVMVKGKKTKAEAIVYGSLDMLSKEVNEDH